MNELTQWIKYELYPALYGHIDIAFKEHKFIRHASGWKSKTYLDGSPHKSRTDKTVISVKAPHRISEWGGENMLLIDYVMRRDKVDVYEAAKTLGEVVGLQPPKGSFDQYSYQKYRDQATLWEDCQSYFVFCLENSPRASEVTSYLSSRGYTAEDIKAMELGYIPDQGQLFKHILSKGHSQSLIDETLKLNIGIGVTHRLTIPWRSGGTIKGFKFRTTGDATPKYLNTTGLDRMGGFFNLSGVKGDKDVIIVEGELDSLSATSRGVENVVSTGGSSISSEQIRDAVKRGTKKFTLCFDTEPGKEETTAANINKAIDIILAEDISRIYVATLPDLGDGKTDPDRLIKERGIAAFKEAVKGEAVSYYQYWLQATIDKYSKIDAESGLTSKDQDNLLDEVVNNSLRIPDTIDLDRYKKLFLSIEEIKEMGIEESSLSKTIEKLNAIKDSEEQRKELKELLTESIKLLDQGETADVFKKLDGKANDIRLKDRKTAFSNLLLPVSEEQLRSDLAGMPGDLDTGYKIKEEKLLLPGRAITVYAACTGHGKTAMAINTALNVATAYPEKKFVFFTYEEHYTSILQYFLNAYAETKLNDSSGSNRRLIRDYFKTGSTGFIAKNKLAEFESKKEEFFKTYIETGRILVKYVELDARELNMAIRFMHKQEPSLGGVFIDYFQLLRLSGKDKREERVNTRQEELKVICQELKRTAADTGLPICLGAQFKRDGVNSLLDMQPTSIREAADIEQIVNTLVGLWDISKITDDDERKAVSDRINGVEQGMYVELLKSRDLRTGIHDVLYYDGNLTKIKNMAKQHSKPWLQPEDETYG